MIREADRASILNLGQTGSLDDLFKAKLMGTVNFGGFHGSIGLSYSVDTPVRTFRTATLEHKDRTIWPRRRHKSLALAPFI